MMKERRIGRGGRHPEINSKARVVEEEEEEDNDESYNQQAEEASAGDDDNHDDIDLMDIVAMRCSSSNHQDKAEGKKLRLMEQGGSSSVNVERKPHATGTTATTSAPSTSTNKGIPPMQGQTPLSKGVASKPEDEVCCGDDSISCCCQSAQDDKEGHPEPATGNPPPTGTPPPPPPLAAATSVAGAYALPGPGSSSLSTLPPSSESEDYNPPPPLEEDSNTISVAVASISSLAVANLVVDIVVAAQHALSSRNREGLQRATDVDHEMTRKRREVTKQFKRNIIWGVLSFIVLLVIIVVAVILLVVPRRKTGSSFNKEASLLDSYGSASTSSRDPSPAPSSLESSLLSLFPESTRMAILEEPDSPQSRAFGWLTEDVAENHLHTLPDQRIIQRFVLATIYYSSSGDSWVRNDRWLNHTEHECNWYRTPSFATSDVFSQIYSGYLSGFFSPSEPPPTACTQEDALYQHLWLDFNNLVGSLPLQEVSLLTTLQTLSVVNFQLSSGILSSHIGKLTKLQGLAMQVDSPYIPSQIGLLTNLRSIGIATSGVEYKLDNDHEGQSSSWIPTEFWQLTNLESVYIENHHAAAATGSSSIPPSVVTFPRLKWLVIKNYGLTGTIPSEIGQIDTLEWLVLQRNGLSGSIPTELGSLPKLARASVDGNRLDGSVPSELGLLESPTLLSFGSNQITGTLPSELGLLKTLSATLDFQQNFISGTIPRQLANLTSLYQIILCDNNLSGGIASEFGLLTSLGHLDVRKNALSGTVPQEMSGLTSSLYSLNLEGNPFLSGVIPDNLCKINATCIGGGFDLCTGTKGVTFDCTEALCGCGCPC